MKKHNFSAGPSILPQEVFEKTSQAILDFDGTGLSILEISHRSPEFMRVMEQARAISLDLASLGDDYEVLFLQGGASTQFLSVAYNLLKKKRLMLIPERGRVRLLKKLKLLERLRLLLRQKKTNIVIFQRILKSLPMPIICILRQIIPSMEQSITLCPKQTFR